MTIAILIVSLLILVIQVILLFRDRVVIHPNNEWSLISEENSQVIWNQLVNFEGSYLRVRIHSILENNSDQISKEDLADAFIEAHDVCLQISNDLGSANPYGVDPILVGYVALVSAWFARKARNYGAWAEIAKDDAKRAKSVWYEVAKEAAKGGVAGFLGGWLAMPSVLSNQHARIEEEEKVFESRIAPIRSEMESLEYEKTALGARIRGLQKHFEVQFGWKFEA